MHLYLYGPPGSGKSTIGQILAQRLDLPFIDLDAFIERAAKQCIPDIFALEGEAGFRAREAAAFDQAAHGSAAVIALGGGALLNARIVLWPNPPVTSSASRQTPPRWNRA